VTVTNLFRNLPVRRQFYANKKKQKEEMKKVEDAVMAFALLSHDVRFCLKHNNNVIWQKQPLADVKSALINVFGVNAMMHMEHVKRKSLETEVLRNCRHGTLIIGGVSGPKLAENCGCHLMDWA